MKPAESQTQCAAAHGLGQGQRGSIGRQRLRLLRDLHVVGWRQHVPSHRLGRVEQVDYRFPGVI